MKTLLIVDDDRRARRSLRRVAEMEGLRVLEADDGKAALGLVETERVEIVLTDVFMPDVDGLELVHDLRRSHPDIRIVVMSGGGAVPAPSVLGPARLMGASRVLQKPFGLEELREVLREPLASEVVSR